MATILQEKYCDIGDYQYERDIYLVYTDTNQTLVIKVGKAANGHPVVVRPYFSGMSLEEIAKIVEGCFESESNFFESAEKILSFKCERKIMLEYNEVAILVTSHCASAEQIVKKWQRKEKLKAKKEYYIIGVRKLAPIGKLDGVCKVLAVSEKDAVEKIKKGYDYCECTCFGKYDENTDTFELKNASKYMNFKEMFVVEH